MARDLPSRVHVGQEYTKAEALKLDEMDDLRHLRSQFIIPTKAELKSRTLSKQDSTNGSHEELGIYLCGNSLGLQPHRTADLITDHLRAWASKGVFGHFKDHDDSRLPAFVDLDEAAAQRMAPVVGASPTEVAVMETLTANLHFMMASFYRPNEERFKIILEGKAFPSDHYAIESQIRHNGLDPDDAMILIEPADPSETTISTSQILSIIDEHASSTALILLPGVQYYTGQCFDIQKVTAHAHHHEIAIGWDLAHAVGNVELSLHAWDVDFAVWCSYKYLNCGPGAIAGLFIHERHGKIEETTKGHGKVDFKPRLSGWWGGDKVTRFQMGNQFIPIPGAAGFQVGNPCALAICPLIASLEIFEQTSMKAIRSKSTMLTNYLEELLQQSQSRRAAEGRTNSFEVITPSNPAERGAQLSIRLQPGLLEWVMADLEKSGVVVDERKPDVVRVAPAPLYNTFGEVWQFVDIFTTACTEAQKRLAQPDSGSATSAGIDRKGWSHIK